VRLGGGGLGRMFAALAALACLAAAADPADRLANPAQEARAKALFSQIRCVVCQNESIDDSEADVARDLRQAVRREVAAGDSDAQVRDYLVQRYGEFILLKPPFSLGNAALWLAPFLIVAIGVVVLVMRSRRAPSNAVPDAMELTPEEQKRLSALKDV
jgi:cytochrome c-type biogenesis protein CcmH